MQRCATNLLGITRAGDRRPFRPPAKRPCTKIPGISDGQPHTSAMDNHIRTSAAAVPGTRYSYSIPVIHMLCIQARQLHQAAVVVVCNDGTKYLVPHTWYQVPGTTYRYARYLVRYFYRLPMWLLMRILKARELGSEATEPLKKDAPPNRSHMKEKRQLVRLAFFIWCQN